MRVMLDTRLARTRHGGIGRNALSLAVLAAGQLGRHELLPGEGLLDFASPGEEELAWPAILEREAVDALHSPLFHLPAVLPARAVVTVHDAIPVTHPALATAAFRRLWGEAGDAAARADAVVCPTAAARDDVIAALRLPREKVHVVPEAPHPAFGPAREEALLEARRRLGLGAEPFLLALGALEPRKGVSVLLEALRLAPLLPRVLFVGPAGSVDLPVEAERFGVGARVRHAGVLPDEQLVPLLAAAEALVFPTLAEGFGLPVVEAFATGTPVVASAVPAVREVAGEGALLVPPGDPQALAGALTSLIADPALGRALREQGRARLARYSPAAVRAALITLYDALESAGGGR